MSPTYEKATSSAHKTFKQSPTMTEDLLKYLYSYKVSKDYKDKDFDGDRAQQYYYLQCNIFKKLIPELFLSRLGGIELSI